MARSKRHHYIPEVLQKRFCKEGGKLWYAKNESKLLTFELLTPRGCFWERNLNTTMVDEKPSDRLETDFWKVVDDHLTDLLDETELAFRKGLKPVFRGQPLASLRELIVCMMRRAPDATDLPDAKKVGIEVEERIAEVFDEQGMARDDRSEDTVWLRQNGRHILASIKVTRPEKVLATLSVYSAVWAVAEQRSSFILGSRMVYRASNGGTGHLDDPNTELFWPVSPKRAIVFLRKPHNMPDIMPLGKDGVREWNEHIFEQSAAIASHSEALLRSLTKRSGKIAQFLP